jgi:hypothetical protein
MIISEVTGWVLTMIIMYQPSIYISIDENVYETATQCMEARARLLEAYEDDDPSTHFVIGCHPSYDRRPGE